MEITQFTYFQEIGGIELSPITGEITYGTERIAMYLQQVNNVFDLAWTDGISYGDIHHETEVQFSRYNFEQGDVAMLMNAFQSYEAECKRLFAQTRSAVDAAGLRLLYQIFSCLQSARMPGERSVSPSARAISPASGRWPDNVPSDISKSGLQWAIRSSRTSSGSFEDAADRRSGRSGRR